MFKLAAMATSMSHLEHKILTTDWRSVPSTQFTNGQNPNIDLFCMSSGQISCYINNLKWTDIEPEFLQWLIKKEILDEINLFQLQLETQYGIE